MGQQRFQGGRIVVGLLVSACLAGPSAATEDDVEALRREVAELRQLVQDMQADERRASDAPDPASSSAYFNRPNLDLAGFTNVNYDVQHLHEDGVGNDDRNFFELGPLDLFITSEIADDVSALAEVLFVFEDGGESAVDVERLLLKWSPLQEFNASVGRVHTPVGYWNIRYHHAAFLYTTVERPLVFMFEDDGGILPVHTIGLELAGTFDTDPGLFQYMFDVGNGRGITTDAIQLVDDLNDSKRVSLMLAARPFAAEGLQVGANILWDEIPPNPAVVGREDHIYELISGAHFVYEAEPFEILVEEQVVRHQEHGDAHYSHGGYAQLAYAIGAWKPYYRFDWLGISKGATFYAGLPGVEDTQQHTFGIRFDWRTFVALKLEARLRDSKTFHSTDGVAQVSFGF